MSFMFIARSASDKVSKYLFYFLKYMRMTNSSNSKVYVSLYLLFNIEVFLGSKACLVLVVCYVNRFDFFSGNIYRPSIGASLS